VNPLQRSYLNAQTVLWWLKTDYDHYSLILNTHLTSSSSMRRKASRRLTGVASCRVRHSAASTTEHRQMEAVHTTSSKQPHTIGTAPWIVTSPWPSVTSLAFITFIDGGSCSNAIGADKIEAVEDIVHCPTSGNTSLETHLLLYFNITWRTCRHCLYQFYKSNCHFQKKKK